MDPVLAAALTSALVQIVQAGIALARVSGRTPEEIKAMFDEEWAKFQANDPNKLPG